MTIADHAIANALQIEAKKHALRQQQDGCWIFTMKVHQDDMPTAIMKAPMGSRYVMALVEIGDDEQPVNHELPQRLPAVSVETTPRPAPTIANASAGVASLQEGGDAIAGNDPEHKSVATTPRRQPDPAGADKPRKSPAQVAGFLCTHQPFIKFLREKYRGMWSIAASRQPDDIYDMEEIAAECVRLLCRVESRSELTEKNVEWTALRLAYRLWEHEAEIVPA